MRYLIHPDISLRSWWRTPYAYYSKGQCYAHRLTQDEYELLSLCDGKTELEPNGMIEALLRRRLIVAEAGELRQGQNIVCDNRYFPAMNWMITGKCNYNCLHCFNAADNNRLQSEFSWEEAKRLIAEYEPDRRFEMMQYAEQKKVSQTSNTQLYKMAGNSIVVDVLYHIYKSLYSAMPYLFEDLKVASFFSGIGAFEKGLDLLFADVNAVG